MIIKPHAAKPSAETFIAALPEPRVRDFPMLAASPRLPFPLASFSSPTEVFPIQSPTPDNAASWIKFLRPLSYVSFYILWPFVYFALIVPSFAISSSVRLPYIFIFASSVSIFSNSESDNSTSAAPRFSNMRASFLIPGMGTMKSLL